MEWKKNKARKTESQIFMGLLVSKMFSIWTEVAAPWETEECNTQKAKPEQPHQLHYGAPKESLWIVQRPACFVTWVRRWMYIATGPHATIWEETLSYSQTCNVQSKPAPGLASAWDQPWSPHQWQLSSPLAWPFAAKCSQAMSLQGPSGRWMSKGVKSMCIS